MMIATKGGIGNDGGHGSKEVRQQWLHPKEAQEMRVGAEAGRRGQQWLWPKEAWVTTVDRVTIAVAKGGAGNNGGCGSKEAQAIIVAAKGAAGIDGGWPRKK